MYSQKKIQIASKLTELNDVIDGLDIMLEEYEDIKNIVNKANLIIGGKYDSLDYVIQESQIDLCLNSIDNMISRFRKRIK